MKELAVSLLILAVGPAILLILLPVIPTIWVLVVYPAFSFNITKFLKINCLKKKIALFYLFSVACCIPALSYIRKAVNQPELLWPIVTSKGFLALMTYSIGAPLIFPRIGRTQWFQKNKKRAQKALDLITELKPPLC